MGYQGWSEQQIADHMKISKNSVLACLESAALVLQCISPVNFQTIQEIADI